MRTVKIQATFHDSCIAISNNHIIASSVSYETAQEVLEESTDGGIILQEFIDANGYIGYIRTPYNMADED